jgi:hypothetical protein
MTGSKEDLRAEIRELIVSDVSGGRLPLRKYEVHRAYYALTGEKLTSPSFAELRHELLGEVQNEARDPFECSSPFRAEELKNLCDTLEDAADEVGEVKT